MHTRQTLDDIDQMIAKHNDCIIALEDEVESLEKKIKSVQSAHHTWLAAVKRIVRCLQGAKDRGLIFKLHTDWKVDCFVDTDFCCFWGSEDPNDPVATKSRTGHVILLAGVSIDTLRLELTVERVFRNAPLLFNRLNGLGLQTDFPCCS